MHQHWPHTPRPAPNTLSRSAHRAGVSGAIWISGGRGELTAHDIHQCLAVCPEPSRPGRWIGEVEPNGDRLGRSRQVNSDGRIAVTTAAPWRGCRASSVSFGHRVAGRPGSAAQACGSFRRSPMPDRMAIRCPLWGRGAPQEPRPGASKGEGDARSTPPRAYGDLRRLDDHSAVEDEGHPADRAHRSPSRTRAAGRGEATKPRSGRTDAGQKRSDQRLTLNRWAMATVHLFMARPRRPDPGRWGQAHPLHAFQPPRRRRSDPGGSIAAYLAGFLVPLPARVRSN